MGTEIIRQPDGQYALFSHISDILFGLDMTRQEVADHFAGRVPPHLREADILDTHRILDRIDKGGTHYEEGAMSFKQALRRHTKENCLYPEINEEVEKRKPKRKKNAKDGR